MKLRIKIINVFQRTFLDKRPSSTHINSRFSFFNWHIGEEKEKEPVSVWEEKTNDFISNSLNPISSIQISICSWSMPSILKRKPPIPLSIGFDITFLVPLYLRFNIWSRLFVQTINFLFDNFTTYLGISSKDCTVSTLSFKFLSNFIILISLSWSVIPSTFR